MREQLYFAQERWRVIHHGNLFLCLSMFRWARTTAVAPYHTRHASRARLNFFIFLMFIIGRGTTVAPYHTRNPTIVSSCNHYERDDWGLHGDSMSFFELEIGGSCLLDDLDWIAQANGA